MGSYKISIFQPQPMKCLNVPILKAQSSKYFLAFRQHLSNLGSKKPDFFIFRKLIENWLCKKLAATSKMMKMNLKWKKRLSKSVTLAKYSKKMNQSWCK